MVEGKLFKSGSAEDLANDPLVRKVYLGQNFVLKKKREVAVEPVIESAPDAPGDSSK